MRLPDPLAELLDQGIIDAVVRPLKSGKEALVYLVEIDGGLCVAKVYKEPDDRTFKHRSIYTEGRAVRNSRDQRAMTKRTQYGQKKDDEAWRTAEVEAMYRLQAAGVRIPEPYHFVETILLMELVLDASGAPAPRLSETPIRSEEASVVLEQVLRDCVRMLSVGVVHGDLSEFNILMGTNGPVIIDFPQWVDAARNQNARQLLIRDISNLNRFLRRFDPGIRQRPYGEELWQVYERGELTPNTQLTGNYVAPKSVINLAGVEDEIREAEEEHRRNTRTAPKRDGRGAITRGRGGNKPGGQASPPARVQNLNGRPAANNPGTQGAAQPKVETPSPKPRARRRRRRSR